MEEPPSDRDIAAVLDEVYEAALEAGRWQQVTARLGAMFHGSAVLFSQDSNSPDCTIFEAAGFDPAFLASYGTYYAATNAWTPGVATQSAGSLVTGEEILDRHDFERTEWYNDWLRPQRLYHGIGAVLGNERGLVTQLSVIRPPRAGPLRQNQIAALRQLLPHLRRGIKVYQELSAARAESAVAIAGLECLDVAAFLVDARARMRFANASGERLLADGSVLRATSGTLIALDKHANESLTSAVRGCSGRSGMDCGIGGTNIAIPRTFRRPLMLYVIPYRHEAGAGLGGATLALVLVRDPDRPPNVDPAALRAAFGLTQAEAASVALLASGLSQAEIALRTAVSIETVRTHIKRSMAKAEVDRQVHLVSIALRMAPMRPLREAPAGERRD